MYGHDTAKIGRVFQAADLPTSGLCDRPIGPVLDVLCRARCISRKSEAAEVPQQRPPHLHCLTDRSATWCCYLTAEPL